MQKLNYGGEAQILREHTRRLTVSRTAGEHISAEMRKLRRWPFADLKWSGITLFDDLETANRKVKYHCYPLSDIHRHFDPGSHDHNCRSCFLTRSSSSAICPDHCDQASYSLIDVDYHDRKLERKSVPHYDSRPLVADFLDCCLRQLSQMCHRGDVKLSLFG